MKQWRRSNTNSNKLGTFWHIHEVSVIQRGMKFAGILNLLKIEVFFFFSKNTKDILDIIP